MGRLLPPPQPASANSMAAIRSSAVSFTEDVCRISASFKKMMQTRVIYADSMQSNYMCVQIYCQAVPAKMPSFSNRAKSGGFHLKTMQAAQNTPVFTAFELQPMAGGRLKRQIIRHSTMLKRVFRLILSFTNKIQRKGGKPLQIKEPPCKRCVCRGLQFVKRQQKRCHRGIPMWT